MALVGVGVKVTLLPAALTPLTETFGCGRKVTVPLLNVTGNVPLMEPRWLMTTSLRSM